MAAETLTSAAQNTKTYVRSAIAGLIHYKDMSKLSPIAPHLYICSRNGVIEQLRDLKRLYGITTVVSMSLVALTPVEQTSFVLNGVQFIYTPIHDVVQQSMVQIADRIHQTILLPLALKYYSKTTTNNNANSGSSAPPERAVVVCDAGMSRSVSVVIYHLMKTYHWTYDQALAWIRKFRPFVQPNEGFEQQLRAMEAPSSLK